MTKEEEIHKVQKELLKHPERFIKDFAIKKETLDKVWNAIREGIGKEQEGFTIEQIMGEKLIATKQPKK